ncbi:hypothetical protein [Streptomyces sp. DH12]|uniref:hypothetical protein n=1 Tax=Streptomyces sp. DH12 TaxID=2857010 RepID=UPI001E2C1C40|nr:hypothetical protein [Streptomyces sp. DH12]
MPTPTQRAAVLSRPTVPTLPARAVPAQAAPLPAVPVPVEAGTAPRGAVPPDPPARRRTRSGQAAARTAAAVGLVYAGSLALHLWLLALMAPPGGEGVRARLLAWDARHFADIAAHGYPDGLNHSPDGEPAGNDLAFFPLYPLLTRAVAALTGVDTGTAALGTSHLAVLAMLGAVHSLLARLHGARTALVGIVLLAGAQPMALTFFMGYSEALFAALAAGALLATHRRAWLTAGSLALLCGLTRPVAAAVALAVAVAAAQHMLRARRPATRPVAAVVLACAGTPAYLAWVGDRVGRMDAWFLIQEAGWGTRWDNGAAFLRFLGEVLPREDGWVPVSTALLVLVLLGFTAAAWRRDSWPPLLVYGTAVVVMALGQSNYFHCKLRLLVPALVFLLPPARALAGARPRTAVAVLAGAVLFGCWYGAHMLTVWPYAI